MTIELYAHPFSSYCQKVLIALYENATPFDWRVLDGRLQAECRQDTDDDHDVVRREFLDGVGQARDLEMHADVLWQLGWTAAGA